MAITAQIRAFAYEADPSIIAEADIDIPANWTKMDDITPSGEQVYRYDLDKPGLAENLARWLESVAAEIRREYSD